MFSLVIYILFFLVYLYFAGSILYLLLFAVAGRFHRQYDPTRNRHKNRIALLIPAYKEDAILIDTVQKACAHNYPEGFFKVIVVADCLTDQTITRLRQMPVQLVEVSFEVSTKAKSIHAAMQLLPENQFDITVILDADNVMAEDCLEKINNAFSKGHKAIQCHRVAKNSNGPVAILEAVSEEININLFRRGQVALGFSAAPLGSGMAFETGLLKSMFSNKGILDTAAEDREIDIELLKRKIHMEFLDDAYVYDEKVTSARLFEKQRTRWFEAQWSNFRRFFQDDMTNVTKTVAYLNKFIQTLILPRLLYFTAFGLIFFLFALSALFKITFIFPSLPWWAACLTTYSVAFIISVPKKYFNIKVLASMFYIPVMMIFMLKAVFKMKKQRKGFLHTPKSFKDNR